MNKRERGKKKRGGGGRGEGGVGGLERNWSYGMDG